MEKEYKKSYAGLIVWIVAMLVFSISAIWWEKLLPEGIIGKILNVFFLIFIDVLMFIIYKGQYVYWICGGPDYETAKAAGEERRKRYCKGILKPFLLWSGVYLVYFLFSVVFRLSFGIDIGVWTMCIIIAALSTINLKL